MKKMKWNERENEKNNNINKMKRKWIKRKEEIIMKKWWKWKENGNTK